MSNLLSDIKRASRPCRFHRTSQKVSRDTRRPHTSSTYGRRMPPAPNYKHNSSSAHESKWWANPMRRR